MFRQYNNPSLNLLAEIPHILEQMNLVEMQNNNNTGEFNLSGNGSFDDDDGEIGSRRSLLDERALTLRVASLENSLIEHINTSVPSLDELVIRQRGRKKQPSKISWSPVKSPFKTPTKRNSSLHMSLLSPSPAKNLFHNASPMLLRSSPRKRILQDTPTVNNDPSSSSTPVTTPTKRMRFFEDRAMNATNSDVPIRTLLKGLTQEQLIKIICDVSSKDAAFEEGVRRNIPLPDVRSFEEQLCCVRRSIMRSSPRSRLLSKTDGAAYSRAAPHLTAYKKAISNHCKILNDSQHFDALLDYVVMAWNYVRLLPFWDEPIHNIIRRECFRVLTINARAALKNGGEKLGAERIANFRDKLKLMAVDYEDIAKCQEALN